MAEEHPAVSTSPDAAMENIWYLRSKMKGAATLRPRGAVGSSGTEEKPHEFVLEYYLPHN